MNNYPFVGLSHSIHYHEWEIPLSGIIILGNRVYQCDDFIFYKSENYEYIIISYPIVGIIIFIIIPRKTVKKS